MARMCARLSKWQWLLPQLSYRGRVLVNLVTSTLWHRLIFPPGSLIDDIHKHLVEVWQCLKHIRNSAASPGRWLLEEPLLHNNLITSQTLSSSSLCCALQRAGCWLRDLQHSAETSLEGLAQRVDFRSSRILDRLVKEVCASLPGPMMAYTENQTFGEQ